MASQLPPPPTTAVDWDNLGFKWIETNGYVKYTFNNGQWDQGEFVRDSYLKIHVCAPALNYGQEVTFFVLKRGPSPSLSMVVVI
jgi:branched-chain amino acid aminotransferase